MAKKKYTIEEIKEALIKSNGFHSTTAKYLNCTIQTVQNYINKSEILKETVKELKYKRDDIVENAIMKGVTEGNTSLIIFYAKTQMRDRGYSEKDLTTNDNSITITHKFAGDIEDGEIDLSI